jgi:hypothetical protein
MLKSTELRWFYSGTLPDTIAHWFRQDDLGEHLVPPETREDQYLVISECDYLNIKLRQNRLEIKCRQAELGKLQVSEQLAGKVEQWIKWMCEDPATERLISASQLTQGPWLRVQKERSQHKYQVLADSSLTTVPLNTSISQGCTVEITQLKVESVAWWSLALEAFGDDASRMHILQTVARWLSYTYPGAKLEIQNSCGYPQWLSKLAK